MWCALNTGRTPKCVKFRKKPKNKIDYNLFVVIKWRNLYSYMNSDKSTIMQTMSMTCVRSTLTAMETSDSIIHSSKVDFGLNQ